LREQIEHGVFLANDSVHCSSGVYDEASENRVSARKLFVARLPKNVVRKDIFEFFSIYGVVEYVKLFAHKNFAFVGFCDESNANQVFTAGQRGLITWQSDVLDIKRFDTNGFI